MFPARRRPRQPADFQRAKVPENVSDKDTSQDVHSLRLGSEPKQCGECSRKGTTKKAMHRALFGTKADVIVHDNAVLAPVGGVEYEVIESCLTPT